MGILGWRRAPFGSVRSIYFPVVFEEAIRRLCPFGNRGIYDFASSLMDFLGLFLA
jgi:hypothetical protein